MSLLVAGLGAAASGARAATLGEAVAAAWSLDPELATAEARAGEFAAKQLAAQSILPAPPALGLRHENDSIGLDRGQREFEAEFDVPVWLPGERGSLQRLSTIEGERFQARLMMRRLDIAGQVRESYWAFIRLARSVETLERQVRAARELSELVTKQVTGGLASDADALLARTETLAAEARLTERRVEREAARQDVVLLTGVGPTPSSDEQDDVRFSLESHPRIVAARLGLDVAYASAEVTAAQSRESPTVGLRVRTERAEAAEPYNTYVGIGVRIPFATEARNAPRLAKADADTAEAGASLADQMRRVEREYTRARTARDGAKAKLVAVTGRKELLDRQLNLARKSFEGGQSSLTDLVLVRRSVEEAREAEVEAQVAVSLTRSRVHQAAGLVGPLTVSDATAERAR